MHNRPFELSTERYRYAAADGDEKTAARRLFKTEVAENLHAQGERGGLDIDYALRAGADSASDTGNLYGQNFGRLGFNVSVIVPRPVAATDVARAPARLAVWRRHGCLVRLCLRAPWIDAAACGQ